MPIAFVQSGQTYHVHVDHLGTPQALTDSVGQIAWETDYTPFGAATGTSQGPTFNLRFPGQYYDVETGLHYNWHRYYDPDTGRYITSDPIGLAGGINTYAYAVNNPITLSDPTGLWAAGLNVGGGFSLWGIHVSLSIAGIVDSDGVSGLIVTPEVGMGTRGGGIFARALYAPGDNTFDTLNGFGLSVSASAGIGSTSGTLPYRQETSCVEGGNVTSIGSYPPVMEFGLGKGPAQITNTLGYGFPIGKNRLIGKAIDKLHENLEFMKGEEHE